MRFQASRRSSSLVGRLFIRALGGDIQSQRFEALDSRVLLDSEPGPFVVDAARDAASSASGVVIVNADADAVLFSRDETNAWTKLDVDNVAGIGTLRQAVTWRNAANRRFLAGVQASELVVFEEQSTNQWDRRVIATGGTVPAGQFQVITGASVGTVLLGTLETGAWATYVSATGDGRSWTFATLAQRAGNSDLLSNYRGSLNALVRSNGQLALTGVDSKGQLIECAAPVSGSGTWSVRNLSSALRVRTRLAGEALPVESGNRTIYIAQRETGALVQLDSSQSGATGPAVYRGSTGLNRTNLRQRANSVATVTAITDASGAVNPDGGSLFAYQIDSGITSVVAVVDGAVRQFDAGNTRGSGRWTSRVIAPLASGDPSNFLGIARGSAAVRPTIITAGSEGEVIAYEPVSSPSGGTWSASNLTTTAATIWDATQVTAITPTDGSEMVNLTNETIIRFSEAVVPETVTINTVRVFAANQPVAGRVRVARDNRTATFFYDEPLPASTKIRVVVDGVRGQDGILVDGNADEQPGGVADARFDTLPLVRIPGTVVWGRIFDSYNRNPDGSDIPVVGARVSIDALPDVFAITDNTGYFELVDVPAPEFFVTIDGSTATNAPAGTAYATLGKPFHSVPGQRTQLTMAGTPFDVYLPPMAAGDIVPLNANGPTDVGFGPAGLAQLAAILPNVSPEMLARMQVTYPQGSAFNEQGQPATRATVIPVDPSRLPAPLPPSVTPNLVVSIQAGDDRGFNRAGGSTNFDVPAPVTFPNTEGLAPGEKSLIWSFDHDAGKWVVIGTGTVSADGMAVVSDPGVGIVAPGWHFTVSGTILEVPLARSNYYVCGAGDDFLYADNPNVDVPFYTDAILAAASLVPTSVLAANVRLYASLFGGSTGRQLWDHFAAGSGESLEFPVGSELSQAISASRTFEGLKNSISEAIRSDIQDQANGGSIDNTRIFIPPHLASNRSYWQDSAFLIATIGSIQGTEVSIENFAASGQTDPVIGGSGSYSATLRFRLCDDFGVGVDDIVGIRAASALLDMWVLQHRRSDGSTYRPFIANIVVDVSIQGTFSIPPGYNDVDIRIHNSSQRVESLARESGNSSPLGLSDTIFYRIQAEDSGTFAGSGAPEAVFSQIVLSPNTFFTMAAYQPATNRSVSLSGISAASGALTSAANVLGGETSRRATFELPDVGGVDSDGDRVSDIGEYVLGTNANLADSDNDGIPDGAELDQGLDPLGGQGFPTGLIASLPVNGPAQAVDVEGDNVYVATGSGGLTIVDASDFDNPIVASQFALQGSAQDISVDPQLNIAAVATGSSLQLINVQDPAAPTLNFGVGIPANYVEVAAGVAYAFTGSTMRAVDLRTGEIVQTLQLGVSGTVTGIAREANLLYAYVAGSDNLVSIDIAAIGAAAVLDTLAVNIASSEVGVFAGNDTVWLAGSGLRAINASDPRNMSVRATPTGNQFFTAREIALNGSGLGLVLPDGGNFVQVYNTSDPTNVANFVTQFNLTGATRDVAISRGIGYIASGNRLEVINYRPFDANGVAPTTSVAVSARDVDLSTAGVQVLEGASVPVRVSVNDDVQVRRVDLLINDQVVATDVSFPFDFVGLTPLTGAAGGELRIRARAIDTGGNIGLSDEVRFQIVPDTIAPTLTSISPADGGFTFEGRRSLRLQFNEALATESASAANIVVRGAGTDGQFGTSDDLVVTPVSISLRNDDQLIDVLIDVAQPGQYRLEVTESGITDRAGNALGASTRESRFEVWERTTILQGTDVIFILDVSGSTGSRFDGSSVGDANADGSIDTILDAEIAGLLALTQEIVNQNLPGIRISVIPFSSDAFNADMDPQAADLQLFTGPTVDADRNGVRDVDQILRTQRIAGGTNFEAPLQRAIQTLTSMNSARGASSIFFLSDGDGGLGFDDELATLRDTFGTQLRAFAIGAGARLDSLQRMDPDARRISSTDEILNVFLGLDAAS